MAVIQRNRRVRAQILSVTALAATANSLPLANWELSGFLNLLVTLKVISAVHTDETYDVYITSGDGTGSEWDIVHFPQVATSGAKTFTARVLSQRLAEITTATPGIAAEPTATMKTDTAGSAEGAKTLAAGKVRHGPLGDWIGVWVVIAGSAPAISFTLDISGGG